MLHTLTPFLATVVVTPPLDGMILPGITRDSVLSLINGHSNGSYKLSGLPENLIIEERGITMKEVKELAAQGNLLELFGTGMHSSHPT